MSNDDPRGAAYAAAYAVIREFPAPGATELDKARENGRVWRAVEAALIASGVVSPAEAGRRDRQEENPQ
jgi:hypothetical protein